MHCGPIDLLMCVCVCILGLSVLGLVLMVWREQSVPGDVVMTHRAVLPAPSQQQLSHASYSHNQLMRTNTRTRSHVFTHVYYNKQVNMHTQFFGLDMTGGTHTSVKGKQSVPGKSIL